MRPTGTASIDEGLANIGRRRTRLAWQRVAARSVGRDDRSATKQRDSSTVECSVARRWDEKRALGDRLLDCLSGRARVDCIQKAAAVVMSSSDGLVL